MVKFESSLSESLKYVLGNIAYFYYFDNHILKEKVSSSFNNSQLSKVFVPLEFSGNHLFLFQTYGHFNRYMDDNCISVFEWDAQHIFNTTF